MKKLCAAGLMGTLACIGILGVVLSLLAEGQDPPLRLLQKISLPNVEGRIDHIDVDIKGERLFVAALENGSLEVVDLRAGKWVRSIPGFKKPQGVWYLSGANKLFVASGNDGMLRVFRGNTLELISSLHLAMGANRVAYDPKRKYIYVGYGGKDAGQDYGLIGIVNAETDQLLGDVRVAAHPAEVLLEKSGPRIFVAIYPADLVEVVDREKREKIASWPVPEASHPGVMDLDEGSHRLFIAGTSQHLTVLDSDSGKVVANIPCVDDADGLFFDAAHKRIYVSGDGSLDVFKEVDTDHFQAIARIPTGAGAGTSLLVPELGRLYVAVPHDQKQAAEIQVYEVHP
jgi:DNA-binding beta-propeller fold protein YncE